MYEHVSHVTTLRGGSREFLLAKKAKILEGRARKMSAATLAKELEQIDKVLTNELHNVITFWLRHSNDFENGGFYNCLGEDGQIYDRSKYVWMLGRQVWMYCRLYNEMERYQKHEILDAARKAADFLRNHVKRDDNRCYFCVTNDGKPVKLQRTIFSECFFVMAMAEAGKATGDNLYKEEAVTVLDSIIKWCENGKLPDGHLDLDGASPVNTLSIPLMLFCTIGEVCCAFPEFEAKYGNRREKEVSNILKHIQRKGSVILENVSLEGEELAGCAGRLMNPGHAIETGWILLKYAEETKNEELKVIAIEKFIKMPYENGWDKTHGGIFYFMDADGLSPIQLEWNMKLWWVHCEALISFLMAYKVTNDEQYFNEFKKVYKYTFEKFPDPIHGEWYGYLNQAGSVTQNFKGGPFKGCFHVPRALLMCHKMLTELLKGIRN